MFDVHLQLPDRSIACGADHLDGGYLSMRHICCRRNIRAVTCDHCKDAAVKRFTDEIPVPVYSWLARALISAAMWCVVLAVLLAAAHGRL